MNNYYDEYEEEIDLLEVWNNFLKKWKVGLVIVVICTLIGLVGSLTYNKLNNDKPLAETEKDLTTTTTTTTYTIITTSDLGVNFIDAKYSEDGLTNITANNFIGKYNTASYKNSIINELNIDVKPGELDSLISVNYNNGIITVSVLMDRDWYLSKIDGSDELTNKQAIDKASLLELSIINKIVNDIENDIVASDLGNYEEYSEPVTITSYKSVESINAETVEDTEVSSSKVSVKKYSLIALVLGVVIYCGYVFIITLLDKTLKTPEDIKRYIDYPVLGYIKDEESYKSLATTLTNITESKVFNITSPITSDSTLVNKLSESLNELGNKCVVLDEVDSKKKVGYILINSDPINESSKAIINCKNTEKTIINIPIRTTSKEDLNVTKEIIKNNNIEVVGVVISGLE